MGLYLDPDDSVFRSITDDPLYVDRSGLLEYTDNVLGTDDCFWSVSSPPGFGKTSIAEMICAYYSCGADSADLFKKLKIKSSSTFKTSLNKYHVIRLRFDDLYKRLDTALKTDSKENPKYPTPPSITAFLQDEVMAELKPVFAGCSNFDSKLSRVLMEIHTADRSRPRFIFVVDGWDLPFLREPDDQAIQEYTSFLSSMFTGLLSRPHTALCFLTGVYPVSQESIQILTGNLQEYNIARPRRLARFMGFPELTVKKMCAKADVSLDEMKAWCGGYSTGKNTFFRPASVIRALQSNSFTPAPGDPPGIECLNRNIKGLHDAVRHLMDGKEVKVSALPPRQSPAEPDTLDELMFRLVCLGYLKIRYQTARDAYVSIPNQESRLAFETITSSPEWQSAPEPLTEPEEEEEQIVLDGLIPEEEEKEEEPEPPAPGFVPVYQKHYKCGNDNAASAMLLLSLYSSGMVCTHRKGQIINGEECAFSLFVPAEDLEGSCPMLASEDWDPSKGSVLEQVQREPNFMDTRAYGSFFFAGYGRVPDSDEYEFCMEHWRIQ